MPRSPHRAPAGVARPAAREVPGSLPKIIEDEVGHHLWRYEGQVFPQIGLNAVAGKDPHQYGMDPVRALACVEAWNDFSLDEWCAAAPDRLVPLGIVPTWDPVLAANEVDRVAAKGCRAITFPDGPPSLGLPSFHTDHWDRLWDACEAADTPVCLHFGSGGFVPGFSFTGPNAGQDRTPFAVAIATFGTNSMWATADLLFSGMLQRHPGLKFMLSEGGIG